MSTPLRVLILEDEPADAILMTQELRRAGFEPASERAETEAEFLEAIAGEVDLILADYNLPQFDGLAALRRVREQQRDIPFILVSGAAGEEIAVAALQLGADGYVLKDRLTALGPAVRRAIGQVGLRAEKRAAEAALREAEARYRTLVEQLPEVVFTKSLAPAAGMGKVEYVSPQVEEMLGYAAADWLADQELRVRTMHPDDRDRVVALVRRAHEVGEPYAAEYRQLTRDGRVVWLRTEARLVRDEAGRPLRWQGIARDVTEQHRTEEQLREAEAHYRALVEQVPATVHTESFAPEEGIGKLLYVSPQIEEMLGYPIAAWHADPGLWERTLHPGDRDRTVALARHSRTTGEPYVAEYRQLTRDGRYVWLRREARLVRDAAGRPLRWQGITRDVGEQRRFEEQLRESEERFRTAWEHAPIGLSLTDPGGRYLQVNPALGRLLGYSEAELLATDFRSVTHPADLAETLVLRERALAGEIDHYELEKRYLRKDGQVVWAVLSIAFVRDEEGRPRYAIGHHQDITARKLAEEAVRASEERFRALVQHARDVIVVTDPDGFVRYVSPAIEQVLGDPPAEFLGQAGFDRVQPDDLPGAQAAFAEVVAAPGNRVSFELRGRHRDGSWRWLDATVTNLFDEPSVAGTVFNIGDITERKMAEEALREAEAKYRAVVEQIPAITYSWVGTSAGVAGRFTYISPQVEAILGYRPDEVVADAGIIIDNVHPDERDQFRAEDERTERTGEPFALEYRLRRRDGRYVWLRDEAVLVRDERGSPLYWQGVLFDLTARKLAEEAVRASQERFRALVQHATDITSVITPDGVIQYVSPAIQRILGYSPEELEGKVGFEVVCPDDLPLSQAVLADAAAVPGGIASVEVRVRHRDGSWRWHDVVVSNMLGDPAVAGLVVNSRDVTERKWAEEELRFRAELLDQAMAAVIATDPNGVVSHWNRHAETLYGWSQSEAIGQNIRDLTIGPTEANIAEAILAQVERGQRWEGDFQARRKDGTLVDVHVSDAPVFDARGRVVGIVGVSVDISERKAYEAQLTHQALHDGLTGLPNRALLSDRLHLALRRIGETGGDWSGTVAVLFIDLDRFKLINDSLGHAAGDAVLIEVARRLLASVRGSDTVARFGGDEFVVLLEEANLGAATTVADHILAALRVPIEIVGQEAMIGASIGLALGGPTATAEGLLRDADAALHRAKEAGRGRHVLFDPALGARARARLTLEASLRRAIAQHELVLHYQPEVDLASGTIVGVEALVRWDHPERGVIPPAEFLPLAEETGLIAPLGSWVLTEATRQAAEWRADPTMTPVAVSVNVAAGQFRRGDLLHEVWQALGETGLDPTALRLEVTEQALVEDVGATARSLGALRRLGVGIAIDDFGTGYSSLAYLRQLPANSIKLDRRFVRNVGVSAQDRAIVRAVTQLAEALGMMVTVEGIETVEQLSEARAAGAQRGQGYFFGRPQPADALRAQLRRGRTGELSLFEETTALKQH